MALRVLSAGAVKAMLTEISPVFTRDNGIAVEVVFATAGDIRRRLAAGEAADAVIATVSVLGLLARDGLIEVETTVPLGRTLTGICVPANAARCAVKPDISSVEKVRQLLLDAGSFAYTDPAAGGTSGTYFAALLQQFGIAEIVAAKAVLCRNGEAVAQAVANGRADAGSTFISEMLAVEGVAVVGPLPTEIGNETAYCGAVIAGSAARESAGRFLEALIEPQWLPAWSRAGFL